MGVREADAWFLAHGLPYFVDDIRARVKHRLSRGRLSVVLLVALLLGAAAGVATGLATDPSLGISTGVSIGVLALALYAARALQGWVITRWALIRTLRSLGLLLPLATRALPMLLLFVTFLFINAEVWQVASRLRGGVLWAVVMLFGAAAVGFLLVRLDEELDLFDDRIDPDHLVSSCAGTPFAAAARQLVESGADLDERAEVTGLQKANLVLVLLIAQAVQVFLLAIAVFAFFLVFGMIAIDGEIVLAWTGQQAVHPWELDSLSRQLVQVSTFLAAFSGLYFTVYAVTDPGYRQQFFTSVTRQLERAVNARVAYQLMQQETRAQD